MTGPDSASQRRNNAPSLPDTPEPSWMESMAQSCARYPLLFPRWTLGNPTLKIDIDLPRSSNYSIAWTNCSQSVRYSLKWYIPGSAADYGDYVVKPLTYNRPGSGRLKMGIQHLAARIWIVVMSRAVWNCNVDPYIVPSSNSTRNSTRN